MLLITVYMAVWGDPPASGLLKQTSDGRCRDFTALMSAFGGKADVRELPSGCLLLAISGLFSVVPRTSALLPKADIGAVKSRQRPSDVALTNPTPTVPPKRPYMTVIRSMRRRPRGAPRASGRGAKVRGRCISVGLGANAPGLPLSVREFKRQDWVPSEPRA